ncbi:MAG: VCBS repeat-containing protein [Acidobacteria bacterium]|nr:VCBS repeat-containing protein [Acidobacteriota bacterium]
MARSVIGGNFNKYNDVARLNLARLNADGSLDSTFPSFANIGTVAKIVIQTDNKILVGGSNGVVRINPDGTRDNTFNVSASSVNDIVLRSDGKAIIVGGFTSVNGVTRNRVARLNSDGTLDTTFNPGTGPNNFVFAAGQQPNSNGVVIAGSFVTVGGISRNFVARLSDDGTLDQLFDPGSGAGGQISCLKILPNNKILIGGVFNSVGGVPRKKIARLLENGSVDLSFGAGLDYYAPGSFGANIYSFLQTSLGLIVGGNYTGLNSENFSSLSRLKISERSYFDFDGDGKSDVSIFRPSNGQWWLNRSTAGTITHTFGNSADVLTPGDFTGDGKTDVAIFRPSNGEWFVLRSEDFSFYSFPFGASNDIPVPADYDGDGKTDAAVFRPSDATWYIQRSSGGTTIQTFGAATDFPVPADYDGDGKTDIAIFRPSNGQWWLNRSTAGLIVHTFGTSTDKNVQGDYTGDGKTDVAIFRPSTGEWFVLRSEDASFYSFPFGANGDLPAPGDYDGDGKTDAAVFRPSSATWYLQRSTAGLLIQNFGASTDVPVPNVVVRP